MYAAAGNGNGRGDDNDDGRNSGGAAMAIPAICDNNDDNNDGSDDEGITSASARLRRIADKVEILERTKAVVRRLAPPMPADDAQAQHRAMLVDAEALLHYLAGRPLTGLEFDELRDGEVTNHLGGYHLEPLAEAHPHEAVVTWRFEESVVDALVYSAYHVLLATVMPEVHTAVPIDCVEDMTRLRGLVAQYAVPPIARSRYLDSGAATTRP
ncbi:hypothetical protein pdul_cds_987 [Pandoravirus dulcis]|uniref:Uncharacterized protein n=1 Tax=Pandoravirus dulcis TaxID=1349409 RepID=S4VYV5_9VIRU|nr:hypothetical protein pdul_cds_987 [Pandoravirus dulcis]AGO83246.1 hypothetical protein pdul_cds_987 [Pandoravirus dulcis]